MTVSAPIDWDDVARRLRGGALVLFPTETLVGIGCDPRLPDALARLGRLKGRPADQSYPLLVPGREEAALLAVFSPVADRLAARFWPGMLTLVLPARETVPSDWTARDGTIALRVSGHAVAGRLVSAFGGPLIATSANLHGAPAPARMADVAASVRAGVELALPDGPREAAGTGSTLVRVGRDGALTVPRRGAVSWSAIERCAAGGADS